MNFITSDCNLTAEQAYIMSRNAGYFKQLTEILNSVIAASLDQKTMLEYNGIIREDVVRMLEVKLFKVTKEADKDKYAITWNR